MKRGERHFFNLAPDQKLESGERKRGRRGEETSSMRKKEDLMRKKYFHVWMKNIMLLMMMVTIIFMGCRRERNLRSSLITEQTLSTQHDEVLVSTAAIHSGRLLLFLHSSWICRVSSFSLQHHISITSHEIKNNVKRKGFGLSSQKREKNCCKYNHVEEDDDYDDVDHVEDSCSPWASSVR